MKSTVIVASNTKARANHGIAVLTNFLVIWLEYSTLASAIHIQSAVKHKVKMLDKYEFREAELLGLPSYHFLILTTETSEFNRNLSSGSTRIGVYSAGGGVTSMNSVVATG